MLKTIYTICFSISALSAIYGGALALQPNVAPDPDTVYVVYESAITEIADYATKWLANADFSEFFKEVEFCW